jgi:hypothetical protein
MTTSTSEMELDGQCSLWGTSTSAYQQQIVLKPTRNRMSLVQGWDVLGILLALPPRSELNQEPKHSESAAKAH